MTIKIIILIVLSWVSPQRRRIQTRLQLIRMSWDQVSKHILLITLTHMLPSRDLCFILYSHCISAIFWNITLKIGYNKAKLNINMNKRSWLVSSNYASKITSSLFSLASTILRNHLSTPDEHEPFFSLHYINSLHSLLLFYYYSHIKLMASINCFVTLYFTI